MTPEVVTVMFEHNGRGRDESPAWRATASNLADVLHQT
jgi:hypothetical protein